MEPIWGRCAKKKGLAPFSSLAVLLAVRSAAAAEVRTGCRRAALFDVTEGDTALAEVIRGQLQADLVAGEDANVILLHLASSVGDQLVAILAIYTKTRVGQDLGHNAIHFDEFFFCHLHTPVRFDGEKKARSLRASFQ